MNPIKAFLVILLFAQPSAFACSAFLLKGEDYQVIGFNENWKRMPSMVVVNKRGISKHNLAWADLVAGQPAELGVNAYFNEVTSRYAG